MLELLKGQCYEIIYTIVNIVFLTKLHILNKTLLRLGLDDNPIELVSFDHAKPVYYFLFTVIFAVTGAALIVRKSKYLMRGAVNFIDALLSLMAIMVIILIIVLLWIFIDNPIARAILTVGVLGISLMKAFS